jgi:threonine dehydrogenase-like Zn-dependent dehydrogenase
MYRAGDVRIESVPDARVVDPADAVLAVSRACICGSDLWPYKAMERTRVGRRMGHEAIGVVDNITVSGGPAPVRTYIAELLPDILEGKIEPGRVFDRIVNPDEVPDGYRAMNQREAIKVMVEP